MVTLFLTGYPHHTLKNNNNKKKKFLEGYELMLQSVGVGPLQPVTSLCHHVRYVLIEFKDLGWFAVTAREAFSMAFA